MKKAPRAGDPLRAVAYLRVSTEDQNLGPEAQRGQIEAWAARGGAEVVAWFTDHGVSGAAEIADRPGLTGALGALRELDAGVFVVAKRDRLARDVVIAGTIERMTQRSGARVVAADGIGNGDSPAEGFMRNIIDGAAEYERGLIRARTRAALAVKKGRGERVGTLPWGYRLGADGTHLEPCDEERATTRRAIELRASGLTLAGVGGQLAAEGKLTRTGRAFDRGEVRALCLRGEPWNVPAAQLSRLGER